MTREEIENIKRAASSAKELRVDPNMSMQFTFRALDIFARLATPEAIEQLCDAALNNAPAWESSDSEIDDADAAVVDADRYQMARRLEMISALDEVNLDAAIVQEFDCPVGDVETTAYPGYRLHYQGDGARTWCTAVFPVSRFNEVVAHIQAQINSWINEPK